MVVLVSFGVDIVELVTISFVISSAVVSTGTAAVVVFWTEILSGGGVVTSFNVAVSILVALGSTVSVFSVGDTNVKGSDVVLVPLILVAFCLFSGLSIAFTEVVFVSVKET